MPCGDVVFKILIHASSNRRRVFLLWALLSTIVHRISLDGTSWSMKWQARGEFLFLEFMSYLCS